MQWRVWVNRTIVKEWPTMRWLEGPGWHWCWWDDKLICIPEEDYGRDARLSGNPADATGPTQPRRPPGTGPTGGRP